MENIRKEKWQEQVEEILREHLSVDEPSERLKMIEELIELTRKVGIPSGDIGQFLDRVLNNIAGKKLSPLSVAHMGFKLGVAYERYLNANRA